MLPPSSDGAPTLSRRPFELLSLPLTNSRRPFYECHFAAVLAALIVTGSGSASRQGTGRRGPIVEHSGIIIAGIARRRLTRVGDSTKRYNVAHDSFVHTETLNCGPQRQLSRARLSKLHLLTTYEASVIGFTGTLRKLASGRGVGLFQRRPAVLS